ncbi:biopolymer transporter ExbD [Spirulina sp. CS-785/01]|uniref:ExbD/TolR family protein n=1 Tax=Spirulina sp. CS-785/01 TaxID=3021716 RepID=UPI00232C0D57|nr:biopolymer transporter ExbD [Spirulina sp. CS-785/01]MDB9312291.1 biopolymer transporter ExbD [Spirulina sp. CS-785/01]
MRVRDNEGDEKLEINIVPMIDVIFAILAFFILSTLFLTRAEEMPVNLPSAETGDVSQEPDVTIAIDAAGQLYLDNEPIDAIALEDTMTERVKNNSTFVAIHADERTYHRNLIQVMDILRQIDGVRLGLATTPPEEN